MSAVGTAPERPEATDRKAFGIDRELSPADRLGGSAFDASPTRHAGRGGRARPRSLPRLQSDHHTVRPVHPMRSHP